MSTATLRFSFLLSSENIVPIYSKNFGFIALRALGLDIETFAIV